MQVQQVLRFFTSHLSHPRHPRVLSGGYEGIAWRDRAEISLQAAISRSSRPLPVRPIAPRRTASEPGVALPAVPKELTGPAGSSPSAHIPYCHLCSALSLLDPARADEVGSGG